MMLELEDNYPADFLETHQGSSYRPKKDPKSRSLILVAFMESTEDSEAHVEVLASMGTGYEWAVDGDRGATMNEFADTIDCGDENSEDGLYVLLCGWIGTGEDTEYIVHEVRKLDSEERSWVHANADFRGVECYWATTHWKEVECAYCDALPEAHTGIEQDCPVNRNDCQSTKE